MLTTAKIISKTGEASSITPKQAAELVSMGLATVCTEHRFTWHTDLAPEQMDTVLEEGGLVECGFCGAKATWKYPTKPGEHHMVGYGMARARLYACDECVMLVENMDEDLLLERTIERSLELNRILAPDSVRALGEDEVRRQIRPAAEQAQRETFAVIGGKPFLLKGESGFVVIGDDGA